MFNKAENGLSLAKFYDGATKFAYFFSTNQPLNNENLTLVFGVYPPSVNYGNFGPHTEPFRPGFFRRTVGGSSQRMRVKEVFRSGMWPLGSSYLL